MVIGLWNVQNWDSTLGTYTNVEAAKAHGEYIIHRHYQNAMDRRRVPASHRAIDWRPKCCGHLFGPGTFNPSASPNPHAQDCGEQTPCNRPSLRPFWAATGRPAGGGNVKTDWEIWQSSAPDQFDPRMLFAPAHADCTTEK